MQVQNNIASINAARNQGIETGKLKKSLDKLSSGFRIVRAGDDAAGLTISEGMRSRINSLNQAMRNIDDGIGLTNVGDGALTEVHSMLQRLKTLALKSANGTYDQSNRETLNMEKNQILEEIDRIGSTTKFGEISLFSRADANTNINTIRRVKSCANASSLLLISATVIIQQLSEQPLILYLPGMALR